MDQVIINQLPGEYLRGKRVFVRLEADDEPTVSGALVDDSALRASVPTLEYLMRAGARLVIGTHRGEPRGQVVEALRLGPVADRLAQLLHRPVPKLREIIGRDVLHAVSEMRDGETILLENLHFHPGEEKNDTEFARELGLLADLYCNDAFALAHRGAASTVGITRYVRPAAAGLAMAREITMLEAVFDQPDPPFVGLIAGARLEQKLPMIENLLPKLDRLFIGGALSFTFLKARGREVGAAPVDEAFLPLAREFLDCAEEQAEVVLPLDFMVVKAKELRAYQEDRSRNELPKPRRVLETEIQPTDLPVDIGPSTINRIRDLFDSARTFLWNGPLGRWEIEPFSAGTREIAELVIERLSQRYKRSVLCGDSLSRAIRSFGVPVDQLRHLTAGGQSALEMLAGHPLPAVSALDGEVGAGTTIELRPRRILLPVDGSEHSLETVRRLVSLTNTEDAEITLLYVRQPPPFTPDESWMDAETKKQRAAERLLESERIFAQVNAMLARQGLISHRQIAVEGDPAEEILKVAGEMQADLIALGSHGKTGVLRFLMGSVSRKVLDHSKCPVLIVRIPDPELVKAGMLEV